MHSRPDVFPSRSAASNCARRVCLPHHIHDSCACASVRPEPPAHRDTGKIREQTTNQIRNSFLRTKRPSKYSKRPTHAADPSPEHLLDPRSHCLAPLLVQLDDMWPGSTVALLHPQDLRDPSNPPTATNLASNIYSMKTAYTTEYNPNKHHTPKTIPVHTCLASAL